MEIVQSTKTMEETQDELINNFSFFEAWLDKYQYLIDLGNKLPKFPHNWKTTDNEVHGCQSKVWLHVEVKNDKLLMHATSDSSIVSGLIYLILYVYNNRTCNQIINTEPRFIKAIKLDKYLSPTRNNGLYAMLKTIKQHANEHSIEKS